MSIKPPADPFRVVHEYIVKIPAEGEMTSTFQPVINEDIVRLEDRIRELEVERVQLLRSLEQTQRTLAETRGAKESEARATFAKREAALLEELERLRRKKPETETLVVEKKVLVHPEWVKLLTRSKIDLAFMFLSAFVGALVCWFIR